MNKTVGRIIIAIGFLIWALSGPKKVNVKLHNTHTPIVNVANLNEPIKNKRVINIIEIQVTQDHVRDSDKSNKLANEVRDSDESIQPVDGLIPSIKPVDKPVKEVIKSTKTQSRELLQFLALEAKVEELILRIEASNGSWDINSPRHKAHLEYTMDRLSEHANGIYQMKDKPRDLQEYLKRRGSTYPYDTLDAFLKKNDFNGVYKSFNKKLESVDSNDNGPESRERRE